ncbi:MAG: bifunctional DNA-formamidopyrimidine glycosylase/DNA-(apurinic or apyrimidinic site) lyase [Alphaproteobacteria bacterium]|nr:bifunctional DNA-formamidopyrimidine glycosylase/DNA-(apurinic or apyrimidinic site) lyase [Alphaproteobacteria bacterium]
MPELPEVETVVRGLSASITGSRIRAVRLRRKDLRFPFPRGFAAALAGARILGVSRRAKYLLFTLDNDYSIISHLGMSGRFIIPALVAGSGLSKHDHVIITLDDGRTLIYNDPRRFGVMTLVKTADATRHPLLRNLGPEPLSSDFTASYLKAELLRRKGAVKPVLMDQKLVVGVGNIYASEALFLAGIDPRMSAPKAAPEAALLVKSIRKVLRDAIASGGSSLRDFVHISGESGYFQHRFNVYGREGEPCFACKTPLRGIRQAGRATFYCPKCQR